MSRKRDLQKLQSFELEIGIFYLFLLFHQHLFWTKNSVKVPITSVGILNICNLSIPLKQIVIYLAGRKFHLHKLFAVKVDGSDINPGICLYENSLQIPGLTLLPSTLTAKKSMKMKCSADKIYYNFFQENPKITNMQNSHRRCRHFKRSSCLESNCRIILINVGCCVGSVNRNIKGWCTADIFNKLRLHFSVCVYCNRSQMTSWHVQNKTYKQKVLVA